MPVFFVKNDDVNKDEGLVHIYGEDAYHIARALRMAIGESITVSDGREKYACTLASINDSESTARIDSFLGKSGEPPYRVTLLQGMPKGDKLETVIQKSVECGVSSVIPFFSEFCTVRPKDGDGEQKKLVRRNRIAYEAAKQCGRTEIPSVGRSLSFKEMLKSLDTFDVVLFCYEKEDGNSISSVFSSLDLKGKNIALIVGSEGGFSENEAESLKKTGALSVSLGERILRTESAGMFVLAVLSYCFEL